MVEVSWKGNMMFEALPPSGRAFVMDAYSEETQSHGPTPLEAFLSSLAACTAMDVISILKKQRQEVTGYRVEIDGDREPYGSPWPRPYLTIKIRHFLKGVDLDPDKVQKAIALSDEKYCSVTATIRTSPPIETEWVIEGAHPGE